MRQARHRAPSPFRTYWSDARRFAGALRSAGPALLFGLRLWASVCLALYVAFWLELDNAYWAGTSAAIVCQPQPRRLAAQGLVPDDRHGDRRCRDRRADGVVSRKTAAPFSSGLALWGAACALVATLLRNFAAYSAALAGYTAAIIASDQLGATGGVERARPSCSR